MFTLCIDDFGVKYVGREHAEHLLHILRQHYQITVDWSGSSRYIGLNLDWDYEKREVHLSMPGYVKKSSQEIQAPNTTKAPGPTTSPHPTKIWGYHAICNGT
jgi:hypothetical protein